MADLKLPRLTANVSLTDGGAPAGRQLSRLWDQLCTAIETHAVTQDEIVAALQDAVVAIQAAQAAANAANTAAAAAQSAATTAQTAATGASTAAAAAQATANTGSLATSYVTGLTLTSAADGGTCDITISAHQRVYGDGTTVSVSSGSVSGETYDTDYWVFYDQPSRAGGTVSYQATNSSTAGFPSAANPDRHFVGAVHTLATAIATPVAGNPARPANFVTP